jgi:hypothetical protein
LGGVDDWNPSVRDMNGARDYSEELLVRIRLPQGHAVANPT